MSGEIVVPETPNWLQGLEEKRERRLKVRLGHEAGAGAPCLKCGDKCPGLDLHFWRKACKICRCPKEEHDVPDDDIYGWAQFQLLGSKPNKIKTKIVLPGKKDEVELEWAPKGQKEIIDKYLKTLPPESLPVKGSQAAQERKQMLQKQIPIHDIDPSLCHELNEEEVKKMEEYIAHVKKNSVGVGQIVNLSSVIKANLHNISPQEAHIIASRYSKGIPFSEIVKLQSGLAKNLEKLTLNDPKNPKNKPALPNMQPNKLGHNITEQNVQNPLMASKFKDITHPWYTDSSPHKGLPQPNYAQGFKPGSGGLHSKDPTHQAPDYSIDQKLLQGTNFDPSRTPSQFLGYHTPGYRPVQSGAQDQYPTSENIPYDKISSRPQDSVSYSADVEKSKALKSSGLGTKKDDFDKVPERFTPGNAENIDVHASGPNYARDLFESNKVPSSEQYGFENPYFNQNIPGKDSKYTRNPADSTSPLKSNLGKVPSYSPAKFNPQVDVQDPKAPKSVKDLMYSTYDPSKGPLPKDIEESRTKDRNIDPTAPFYDPNVTFNTYKHDPSVIKYEDLPVLGKHDFAKPIGGPHRYKPVFFDSKTGQYTTADVINPEDAHYDPGNSGKGNLPPGHPNYDYKNPENRYKPVYFDSNTGRCITGDNNNLEDSNFDPNNATPGDPNYDPKNPQNRYQPVYLDSATGKYITADPNNVEGGNYDPNNPEQGRVSLGHPNYPKTPQNIYKPVYFDSKTGKCITEDSNNLEGDNYDPNNPDQDNISPKHPNYDPKNPQNRYKPVYFDSKTGSYINGDTDHLEDDNYDPNNPDYSKVNPGHPNYNPKNPQNRYRPVYFDPKTGKYVTEDGNNLESSDPQNYPGYGNIGPSNYPGSKLGNDDVASGKLRKPLSQFQPGHINVPENYLEPHMVHIGAIKDINPDIRVATTESNPGFNNENVYNDNGAEYSPESIKEILNNIKLPDCHYCKKPFEEYEYAVTVDRANVLFHAQCFKCAGCNQSLADNIYFYDKETNNVYCGRDYAKIKGYPRCAACDELIFTKEYCLAENSTFHLKHFCCFQCDMPLAGLDYTLEDEKPYCLPCYETSKAAKCSTCENVIKTDELGCQLNGVHFHAEDRCFRCIVCGVPLMGKKLLLRNEKLFCSHDCFNSVKK